MRLCDKLWDFFFSKGFTFLSSLLLTHLLFISMIWGKALNLKGIIKDLAVVKQTTVIRANLYQM